MRGFVVVVACLASAGSTSFGEVRVKRYDVQTPGPYRVIVDASRDGTVLAFGGLAEFGKSYNNLDGLASLVFWSGSREVVLKPTGKLGVADLWIYARGDGERGGRYALRVEMVTGGHKDAYQRYEFFNGRLEEERRLGIVRESFDEYLARLVLKGFGVVETAAEEASSDLPLSLAFVSLRLGSEIKLVFSATNEGAETVLLDDVRVTDGKPASRNHVGFLRLDASRPARGLAAIPPGATIHGYIAVSRPLALGKRALVTAVVASGKSKSRYIQIWPPQEKPPLPPSVGKISVGVGGLLGAAQLTSKEGTSGWTSVRGVSVRVGYGIFRWLSVEGTVSLFDTELVESEDATGAILRLAGLVHFGRLWVPFARVGIAPAVFRQDARTQGSFLPLVGIGCQRWFGDSLVVSLSASYAREAAVLDLAEVSVQLGYAWAL